MIKQNKVVAITGASSGIGKALAYTFASQGYDLILGARNYVACCEIAYNLIKKYSIDVLAAPLDVSDEQSCKQFIDQAKLKFNKLDVMICNAGISMRAMFNEVDLNVLHQVMNTNFWGAVYCTKYALPLIQASKGSVIGISSIAGKQGLPARTGYSASKFALEGFLQSIRIENLHRGVHVLIACPGFTSSNIRNVALSKNGTQQGESPLNEASIMSAEQVAKKIFDAYLQRKDSLVLTMQGKLTVFLSKFFPSILNKLVFNHFAKEPNSPLKA